MKPKSLRTRVTLAATLTLGIWVALMTIGFNLVLTNRLAAEADDVLRIRAEAVASTLVVSPAGVVAVQDSPSDAEIDIGTWIFQGKRLVEGPTVATALGRQAQALAVSGGRFIGADQPYPRRMYAYAVMSQHRRVATVVTSVVLSPYARAKQVTLLGSAVLAMLLLGGVFVVLRSAVSRALSPVEAMTRQAASWSVLDVPGRFGDDVRPTELAVLARNLDALLDRLAAVLRHEQQLAAELSHELRTPLSRIIAETDMLQEGSPNAEELRAGHASIVQGAEQMRDILETLLATARTTSGAPTGRCDAVQVANALVTRMVDSRSPKVMHVIHTQKDVFAGVDAAVLARALAPILDNALRYAVHEIHIELFGGPGAVLIDIADDGPGIPGASLPHVFEPGRRADPADGHHGAGLGLALARRLLVASGGEVSASSSPRGAVFHLRLPRG